MKEYIVIVEGKLNTFVKMVNEKMQEGFEPLGGVCIENFQYIIEDMGNDKYDACSDNSLYHQSMVRNE